MWILAVALAYGTGFLMTLAYLSRIAREEYLKSNEENIRLGYEWRVPLSVLWILMGGAILLMSLIWPAFVLFRAVYRPKHIFLSC